MKSFIYTRLLIVFLVCFSSDCFAKKKNILYTLYSSDFSTNKKADTSPGFSLEAELGVISTSGNTETTSFNGRIVADHELVNWSNRYIVEAIHTQSRRNNQPSFSTTAQRFNTSVEADYKLIDPRKRIFLFADYEDNRFDGFDKQASIAAGWAKVSLETSKAMFRYSIGPGYNFARPDNPTEPDASGLIVRASAEYIYNWSSGARLRQSVTTAAGNINTLSRSETSISTKVIDDLSMRLSLILDHNSSPNENIQSLDTRTSISLVYQFF